MKEFKCELCKTEQTSVLTPTNFKNMVWRQGKKYEEIKENTLIERLEIELCYDCRKKLFEYSKVIIIFSQELLNALVLCDKEIKEINVEKEEIQRCLKQK